MTLSHHAPALDAPDLTAALDALRAHGLRVSASRRQVLATLYADPRPRTAEELAAGGDVASVYRNLDTLQAIGLVRHAHLGHGPGLYSLAGADIEFVTCERCGAYEAVEPERLALVKDLIEQELGYRPRFTHFPIVGLCSTCSAASDPPTPDRRAHHAHP